ncbi:CsbD family protein [Brevundimonas sp.]|uniref:CsbD family protein n=1 Tax=Brevundimonas sp. TaxID=1871086 RepID=UPI003514F618
MNKDQVEGRAKEAMGNVKDAAGDATDNRKLQAEGKADQVEGKVQKTAGDVTDDIKH